MPDPQLIQVNKYPNRRLYDQTRSRHLTHEELYDLVVAGHTVRVTESKTGVDITNVVLTQALIERSPEKFASFPPEVFHLMIRASEQMLAGMSATWFSQMMQTMGGMGPLGPMGPTGPTGRAAEGAAAGGAGAGNPWAGMMGGAGFPWMPGAVGAPGDTGHGKARNRWHGEAEAAPGPAADPVKDLQERMEAMMREIAELKGKKK